MSATSLPEQKKALRARLRQVRREASATQGRELAARAHAHLLESPLWRQARTIALYVSLPDELDTAPLLDAAWQAGKTLYLPRVRQQYGLMDFVAVRGREELRPGPFQFGWSGEQSFQLPHWLLKQRSILPNRHFPRQG